MTSRDTPETNRDEPNASLRQSRRSHQSQDDGFGKGTPEQRSRGGEGKKAELKEAGNHRSFVTGFRLERKKVCRKRENGMVSPPTPLILLCRSYTTTHLKSYIFQTWTCRLQVLHINVAVVRHADE